MSISLPQGSQINIDNLNGHTLVVIPHGGSGIMRYVIGLFLLFWMGAWFVGFTHAFSQIKAGEGGAFLIFWLGGWSVGGVFAGYMIYRVFRKSIPEQFLLNRPQLSVDTGIPPLNIQFGLHNQHEYWKSMFPQRKRLEFSPAELRTLELRETGTGNRLTLDKGSERIDLAVGASEIEREWLYNFLVKHYD